MIKCVEFKNFKVLRDTKLPLGQFTLIVGPNGSGKSTALEGLRFAVDDSNRSNCVSIGLDLATRPLVGVTVYWGGSHDGLVTQNINEFNIQGSPLWSKDGERLSQLPSRLHDRLAKFRPFSLDAKAIAAPVALQPEMELGSKGDKLAGVLDRLRDLHPERFIALNTELGRWLPEFDHLLFDTTEGGKRVLALRLREGGQPIPAADLSHGTLLALTLLTLAYLPDPPPIIGLEEPDHGIHPRLLRDVRDALYRLAYPESFGEDREPVQVIATTHSPTMLDLFRDHPEEIVIAEKVDDNVRFERLSDRPDIDEILGDTPLGDAWYAGILGGVPAES